MNTKHERWMVSALGLLLFAGLCACIATGPGYDGGVGVGYVGGYHEPYGSNYGGWGHGYYVAPPRGGERRPEQSSPHVDRPTPPSHPRQPSPHAYRPAPPTRRAPTIPTRPHDRHNP